MRTISTITFHKAHNFGSALQAYALQYFITKLHEERNIEFKYQLINYHTKFQEDLYSVFKSKINAKNVVKNILALRYWKQLKRKYNKFEDFINSKFILTRRYFSTDELIQEPPTSDYFISGSDQIWNVRAQDFSDAYYLNFVNSGKRISYAASFGPLEIDWKTYDSGKYSNFLNSYEAISTRETGSSDNVRKLIDEESHVHVDPTFLLDIEQWRAIQSDATFNDGKYILLYCLEPTKEQISLTKQISNQLGLPVVVLRYNNRNDWFNPFVKRYGSGPLDFLSYIDNAALVLSSSFHGTAFSIIYHKPFYVFNGMEDNRISSILTKTGLTDRSISSSSDLHEVSLGIPNGNLIDHYLSKERERAKLYLTQYLDII